MGAVSRLGGVVKNESSCNNTTIPYISLFSGYEGIGLGIKRIVPNLRTIAYCEREAFACQNLVDKIEKGRLDAAPIFTDVHTFPWEQYAPFMANGILSFGFPCQPVSCAGKRKIDSDKRWLFDVCADGISALKPGILFAENVEGLLSAKMQSGKPVIAHIFERLEELHYTVEAGLFSASEVGAPHQRKRVFILAHTNQQGPQRPGYTWEKWRRQSTTFCSDWRTDAYPARPGEPQYPWEPPRVVAESTSHGLQNRRRKKTDKASKKPKRQGERQAKRRLGGTPDEPTHRMDPNRNRIDRLRLLGNGVVPATATKAFATLMGRIVNPIENTRQIESQGNLFPGMEATP